MAISAESLCPCHCIAYYKRSYHRAALKSIPAIEQLLKNTTQNRAGEKNLNICQALSQERRQNPLTRQFHGM